MNLKKNNIFAQINNKSTSIMKKNFMYALAFISSIFIGGMAFNHISPLAGIFILLILGFILINYIDNNLKKEKK